MTADRCAETLSTERQQRLWKRLGNDGVDFHGEQRTNDTHESKTDPDARLYRKGKGKEAKLCYAGHVIMENRNGLAMDGQITKATGTAERDATLNMLSEVADEKRKTVGTDKAYDTQNFVEQTRAMKVTPHVTQNTNGRSSAIDGRTTRHEGYRVSLRCRARIEELFGWLKTVGGQRKTPYRGERLVGWMFDLSLAAYNLVRMRNLAPDLI
jgi:hypothetical protein